MTDTAAVDLYAGFHEPLPSFPQIVVLILAALPFAALVGFRLGRIERRRRGYAGIPSEHVPGGTSLGAMLALLGLLLGFAFSSALGWREGRQAALVGEAP